MSTAAVVAVKPFAHAKSRLGTLPGPLRRRLAWCMTMDTLRALATAVDQVYVVSSVPGLQARLHPLGAQVRVCPETAVRGINTALTIGADAARRSGADTILACVGDLPSLRPSSVRALLAAAPAPGRGFVADASGVGTTMLVANQVDLAPSFQGRSAAAHRAQGAQSLDLQIPDARRDVDTEVDLGDAVRLGVGSATRDLLDPATGRPGRYSVVTTVAGGNGHVDRAVTAAGVRCTLPRAALAAPLRALRPGQRLHAVLDGSPTPHVLSAWLGSGA